MAPEEAVYHPLWAWQPLDPSQALGRRCAGGYQDHFPHPCLTCVTPPAQF